jgi:hypothetical protein
MENEGDSKVQPSGSPPVQKREGNTSITYEQRKTYMINNFQTK